MLFPADDIPTMISNAKAINDDEQIDAYIPVTLSVPDPADNKRKTMQMVAPTLTKTIRKIDLSLNASFTEYGFFGGWHRLLSDGLPDWFPRHQAVERRRH
ncbi:MAG: hypothetical protein MZV65_35180 [Chromatiales bacterium]|nr:hypothetical protein [Chromatiales bacterium]